MTKKTPSAPSERTPAKPAVQASVMVPDYYQAFRCIGADCEDSCCEGWLVTIDEPTWRRYQSSRHQTLVPLFKTFLVENEKSCQSKPAFGTMKVQEDKRCPFLQSDKLCMIQKELGAAALSDTCASFPRYYNQFGGQREFALDVACPEAARKVLLHPDPIRLTMLEPAVDLGARDFVSYRFPMTVIGDPEQIDILNEFRALILAILQFRELTLGARMMVLGFLMAEADRVFNSASFAHASEILPVLSAFVSLLGDPVAVEAQFEQIPADLSRKLQVTTELVSGCLSVERGHSRACILDVVGGFLGTEPAGGNDAGLLQRYQEADETHYRPYFAERDYILENYLVNEVLLHLFPFTRASYIDLYRELVCNLAILQVSLVAVAGHYQGLTDTRVVRLIQTFARKSGHDSSYLGKLTEAIGTQGDTSFVGTMWLLKTA